MKKALVLFLILILGVTLLGACGSEANAPTNTTPENNQATGTAAGWDYIAQKGTLIIGLDDTFAPMGFRDEKGELVGFDIDMAKAVAEYLGVEPVFQPIDWNAKELELSSKRIDCIWNGMSATPERQESMALTKKYLNNRIVIMTYKSDLAINSVEDLANVKIGTQESSAALETMQSNEAYDTFKDNIVEYKTYDEAIMDMQTGRLDCIVVDEVLGEYKNSKLENKMSVCNFNFGDDFYAIGCRQGETDVADKINEALQTLVDNGKATEISNKWFGRDLVILEGYDK